MLIENAAVTKISHSRRSFLFGTPRSKVTRPPWALEENEFHQICTRCNACSLVCDEKILRFDRGGFPYVDFSQGGCTFCGKCADACEPNALIKNEVSAPWSFQINIKESCLAMSQVVCRTCGERCEIGAIQFSPALGGVSVPKLNATTCTGCGFCIADCPTQAIYFTPNSAEVA